MATNARSDAPSADVQIFQILNGGHVAGSIACLAQLGVPDLIEAGPKSTQEMAGQLGVKAQALYRLLRATASVGVLHEDSDGRFSQTPASSILCTNSNPSLRAFAIMCGREWHRLGWAHLADCIRTGKPALELLTGTSIFDYFQQNPEECAIFDAAMTALTTIDAPAVTSAYSFAGIASIVDIAGGVGLLLAEILKANPNMRGTLYDLPHVIERAKTGPLQPLLARCAFASGDMFVSVPAYADAYLMKHIIHDWPDAECIKLLTACRKGVNPNGKLLVVDNVIHPGNDFAPGKFMDLMMLMFPGGRERTEKEFCELFSASGWRLNRIIPTSVPESILEASAA